MWSWVKRAMAKVTPSTISACHPLRKIFWLPANIWLEQITCDPSMPRYRWWRHRRAFWAAAANSFSAAGQALLQRTWTFLERLLVSQNAANIAQRNADQTRSGAPQPVGLLHRISTGTPVLCAFPPSQTAIFERSHYSGFRARGLGASHCAQGLSLRVASAADVCHLNCLRAAATTSFNFKVHSAFHSSQ